MGACRSQAASAAAARPTAMPRERDRQSDSRAAGVEARIRQTQMAAIEIRA